MTDRAVTHKRRDAKGRIESFLCRVIRADGNLAQPATPFSRHQVASAILQGENYFTWSGGKAGALLEIAIKTHPDASVADNLDNLPDF
jgi:hypothetical protein